MKEYTTYGGITYVLMVFGKTRPLIKVDVHILWHYFSDILYQLQTLITLSYVWAH